MAVVRSHEASSSACYDVFLSFRGKDTRKNFTDHLYTALIQQGFSTFRDDDETEKGENLKSELQKAIHQSKISIVVMSKDYASSTWCLDELLMILERRRNSKHIVLPVFYDVGPTQVRKQTGRIAEAFGRYEKQFEAETNSEAKMKLMEMIKGWRSALTEVADLIGLNLRNQVNGDSPHVLRMHRLIQEMGREIIRQESHEAGERSRIWHHGDAFRVLKNEAGTKTVEGLTLDMLMLKEDGNNAKKRRYEEFVTNQYCQSMLAH
ncbi:hypothetical protein LguiB_021498 [Lonicera macranthoides]